MDRLLDILTQLAPLWWTIALLVAIVCIQFYYRRFKKLEDKVEHADCKNHHRILTDNDQFIKEIKNSIDRIERILIAKDPDMLNQFSKANSPRQLNDVGRRLFKDSGAETILSEHLEELIAAIAARNPETAYDVEQYSYSVMMEKSSEEWFVPLKNYIYNHPVFDGVNVSVTAIAFIMSLPLRNEYLGRHPEINPDDL